MKYNDLKLYVKCDIMPCDAMRQIKINGPFKRSSPIGAERLLMDKRRIVYITGSEAHNLAGILEDVPYYIEGAEGPAIDDSQKYMAKFIVHASNMTAYDGWKLHREVSMYGGNRIIVVNTNVIEDKAEDKYLLEEELAAAGVYVYDTIGDAAEFLNVVFAEK